MQPGVQFRGHHGDQPAPQAAVCPCARRDMIGPVSLAPHVGAEPVEGCGAHPRFLEVANRDSEVDRPVGGAPQRGGRAHVEAPVGAPPVHLLCGLFRGAAASEAVHSCCWALLFLHSRKILGGRLRVAVVSLQGAWRPGALGSAPWPLLSRGTAISSSFGPGRLFAGLAGCISDAPAARLPVRCCLDLCLSGCAPACVFVWR